MRCINLASLLEVSGWPKPGNVHRTKNYKNTTFEHFLAGIASLQPCFYKFCTNISELLKKKERDMGLISLGDFYKDSAKEMMKWQNGGNVLFGHILILSPLVASTMICLHYNKSDFSSFLNYLREVITGATVEDTIKLYEAIRICNPGGLGTIEKYDINDPRAFQQIRQDRITLLTIFKKSRDYDLISSEYATNFDIILKEGLPYYLDSFKKTGDINIATVNTYLKLLSLHPDTLIIRKSGLAAATHVSEKVREILKYDGIISDKGLKLTKKLDKYLQAREGKMNPGTTADLITGVIFMALVSGIRF